MNERRPGAVSYAVYPAELRFGAGLRADGVMRRLDALQAAQPLLPLSLNLRLPPAQDATPLATLAREIGRYGELLRGSHRLLEVHWHGHVGTRQTFEIEHLANALRRAFPQAARCPWRVTLDPGRDIPQAEATLSALAPERLDIVPAGEPGLRVDPALLARNTDRLLATARALGTATVGSVLVYGMQNETPARLRCTIARHLAWQPEHVRLLNGAVTPDVEGEVLAVLGREGYAAIGDGLLGRPNSALARARTLGRLRLQPDGLTTRPAMVALALGPAAVGMVGASYYRNLPAPGYADALRRRELPVMDGLALTGEDMARRCVIHAMLIDFFVDVSAVEIACGLRFGERFGPELRALEAMAEAGLVAWSGSILRLTPASQTAAARVARIFDAEGAATPDADC